MNPICPYCKKESVFDSTRRIYGGKDFGNAFICQNFPKCDAYVGVHKNTKTPKGTLANSKLRELRKKVHELFDPLWLSARNKAAARTRKYAWLAGQMGVSREECHIGMFDADQCKFAVNLLKEKTGEHHD